jgi:hypothetical protein
MKVKDLVKKAGMYKGQEIIVVDHSNHTVEGNTYKLPLSIDAGKADVILNSTVNSFNVSSDGLKIHVSPNW